MARLFSYRRWPGRNHLQHLTGYTLVLFGVRFTRFPERRSWVLSIPYGWYKITRWDGVTVRHARRLRIDTCGPRPEAEKGSEHDYPGSRQVGRFYLFWRR